MNHLISTLGRKEKVAKFGDVALCLNTDTSRCVMFHLLPTGAVLYIQFIQVYIMV